MAKPRIPGYRHTHLRWVKEYAERHFTDPEVSLEDAAVWCDRDARTLRKSLLDLGTSWRAILRELRCARGADLLASTKYKIDDIARLSGYDSGSAFAKVFRDDYKLSPSEYRRGKNGPARAGGATGAFARHALAWRPGIEPGAFAVDQQRMTEARARIEDRNWLERFGDNREWLKELYEEIENPRRLRDESEHWHERHEALAAWIDENDRRMTEPQAEDGLGGSDGDDPRAAFRKS